MDLTLTQEQELITEQARRVLTDLFPLEGLGKKYPEQQWRETAAELGWFGISVPQSAGGAGYTLVEEVLVAQEMGRHLVPSGVLANAIGAHAAFAADSAAALANLLGGSSSCALVFDEPIAAGGGDITRRAYCAESAGYLLGLTVQGAWFCECWEAMGAGTTECVDRDTAIWFGMLESLDVKHVPREQADLYSVLTLLVAAHASGIALAVKEMAVNYAKEREQFGVPVGSFQAVRHPCALMAIRCEAAESQLYYAAAACAEGRPGAAWEARASRLIALDAAEFCCRVNIQVHGGIGITDEHPAHRFLKRVHLLQCWLNGREGELRYLLHQEYEEQYAEG